MADAISEMSLKRQAEITKRKNVCSCNVKYCDGTQELNLKKLAQFFQFAIRFIPAVESKRQSLKKSF